MADESYSMTRVAAIDRGPSPAAEPAIGAVLHWVSLRVFLFDYYD
ncbi:MAG TPA: hypothetical protein VJ724_04035 [Tahibacter sp.]|nr:hypothetical protein [Tahibacter sp.]